MVGLREVKSQRTRTAIVRAALDLYVANGFQATTQEQIAQAAEVGLSTLRRYFPQKELILLEPFGEVGRLAAAFSDRPRDEPLAESLGHAITAFLDGLLGLGSRLADLQEVIGHAPTAQALVWNRWWEERRLLAAAITERSAAERTEFWPLIAAESAVAVCGMAIEQATKDGATRPAQAYTRQLLEAMQDFPQVIPQPPSRLEGGRPSARP